MCALGALGTIEPGSVPKTAVNKSLVFKNLVSTPSLLSRASLRNGHLDRHSNADWRLIQKVLGGESLSRVASHLFSCSQCTVYEGTKVPGMSKA